MNLDIGGGPGALNEIQSALDELWSANAHVPRSIRMQVAMAVTEVAANIIEHARASRIQMRVSIRPDQVQVDFTDNGCPAEVDLAAVRMPDEMARRGRGLALAQAGLCALSHFHDGSENHWKLLSKQF